MSFRTFSRQARRLVIHLRTLLNVLSRYFPLSLQFMHRLFGGLLRLYSRVASTRQQCIGTGATSDQVAGSMQPSTLPLWDDPVSQPLAICTASNISFPTPSASIEPPPSTQALQSSSAAPPVDTDLPFTPSEVSRYDKPPTIEQTSKPYKIQPLTRDYSDTQCTENWLATVHPEGALYFHDGARGIYTDSDMYDGALRRKMDLRIDGLLGFAASRYGLNMNGSGEIELVVQLRKPNRFQYYFVDHLNRSLFWVHEYDGEELFDGVRGVDETGHIRYAVEQRYWTHCEMYPNEKLLRPALLMELREVVIHASAETITTDLSLSPFDGDELSKILDLIDRLRDGTAQEGCKSHSVSVVARFMGYFTRARFFNFYGLPNARLNADQSIYAKGERGVLMLVLSWTFNVALFGAPDSHMRELRSVWVDRTINVSRWKDFNSKLNGEWSGITIYSTVMLAVDVSFLAVPSVMPSGNTLPPQLPPQVVSTYISVFCIVGSLVASLILTGQNRHQESADRAVDFLMKTTGSMFGTKALATVHGLPYAMLLWGMVFFMVAFSYQVFTSKSTVELATTGSACGLMVIFMLWLVQAAKDFHVSTWLISWFREHCSRIRSLIRESHWSMTRE